MKKFVISAAAMGGAALIAWGGIGTFASFTDATTLDSSAGADSFVLSAAKPAATDPGKAVSLQPGGTARYAYQLKNASAYNAKLTVSMASTDVENGRNDAELRAGDPTADTGEFSKFATVQAFYGGDGATCDVNSKQELGGPTTIADIVTQTKSIFGQAWPFTPGATQCVVLEVKLPEHVDKDGKDIINQVQSDRMDFKTTFTLAQI